MGDDQKLKVFLCHAKEDKPIVRKLYEQLKDEGMNPWLDEVNLLPGQDWKHEIKRALKESEAIVICFSNNSINKSGFVQKEIKEALDLYDEQPEDSIFLIPAMLDDCTIPGRLEHLQAAKLYEKNGLQKFLEALKIRATKLNLTSTIISDSRGFPKDITNDARNYHKNFTSAFTELFWEKYDTIKTKKKGIFVISLVGEGGVGKTSLLYVLSKNEINVVGDFQTTTHRISNYVHQLTDDIFINDALGYIHNDETNPKVIELSIENYVDLLVYVTSIDRSFDSQIKEAIKNYEKLTMPLIVVVNKVDKMHSESSELDQYLQSIKDEIGCTALPISVVNGTNIDLLRKFFIKAKNFYK